MRLPFVDADVSLIERVLENMIGNALKHTPAGGRVSVQLSVQGDCLCAQVRDTGVGIPSAQLPFVSDRFYRGSSSAARGSGGAGLGLAITKRIQELHGARIDVQSDACAGTCFTFSLPLGGGPG